MPTGYTQCILNGEVTQLKDYILECSRNFGALVHMRGESSDKEIRHREISEYHGNELSRATKRYEEFLKKSDEEIQSLIDNSYNETVERNTRRLKELEEEKSRYLSMIEKVKSWQPPTSEHVGLKEFALKQLEDSLKFDCSERTFQIYSEPVIKENIEDYKASMIKTYLRDIEYHSKGYKEEIECTKGANKWIDDLINSL